MPFCLRSLALLLAATSLSAQIAPSPKAQETARQALIEMLQAKTPEAFAKHLPASALALLKKDSPTNSLRDFLGIVSELHREAQIIETFESGPLLLRTKNLRAEETIELTLESDPEDGDQDDLQLAVHMYRAGRPAPFPFLPTLTIRMRTDERLWRLDEVTVNLRFPIGDFGFLQDLGDRMNREELDNRERAGLQRLRELSTAEVSYAAAFPSIGFTCVLSDLSGAGDGPSSPHAARIVASLRSAEESWIGYKFSTSGCTGQPVNHFHMVAEPADAEPGLRAFCVDDSAVIRYSEDGEGSSCLRDGEELP